MQANPETPWPDLLPGKHLVLDRHTVADTFRLKRVAHSLQREPIELLSPNVPWEGNGCVPLHVVFDDDSGTYRMWYHTLQFLDAADAADKGAPYRSQICYAESEDGVSWTRPNLGIFDDEGNNICFRGATRACCATITRNPASPGEHLMFNLDWLSKTSGGVCLARSDDGIHWRYDEANPKIFGHSDTTNSAIYNEERGVWMLYMRAWHSAAAGWIENRNVRRRVAYSQSADLENWTESQIVLAPDELDPDDFYGLTVFRYADYYLGLLQIYDEAGEETIDVELAWSRDGMRWERLPRRSPFIARGAVGEADAYMIQPSQSPVVVGDELVFYYAANSLPHNTDFSRHKSFIHLFRGRLRLDGFVSLSAGRELGALITRPFILEGDSISINAVAPGGEIVAELVEPYHEKDCGDPKGRAVEGFGAKDFDVFRGNSTRHVLSWKGTHDLSELRGRRLMLRLSLSCAEIYSFSI